MADNINNMARQKPGTFSTTFNFTGFEQANKLTTGKSFWTTENINISWSILCETIYTGF